MHSSNLMEGLRPMDLVDLIHTTFDIDTYRSKMGEDRDVCVLSFTVKERNAAQDLMRFIEKGFRAVLDADTSTGENSNGEYYVFVEFNRTSRLPSQIMDLIYGIRRLTGESEWSFTYHKKSTSHKCSSESIREVVPLTPDAYDLMLNRERVEETKNFFNKTLMDDIDVNGNIITIYKPYGQTINLEIVREGNSQSILEGYDDPLSVDNIAIGEVFWLSKVLGDYNISKIGDSFYFENESKAMLLKRLP